MPHPDLSSRKTLPYSLSPLRMPKKTLMPPTFFNSFDSTNSKIKEREDASFSEVILELVESKELKKVGGIKVFFGILKGDNEYGRVLRELKSGWGMWTKKYA